MSSNDISTLTERLATQLHDPTYETWAPEELEDLLVWSLAQLSPLMLRPIDPTLHTVTLVSGTYHYDLPPEYTRVSRVDWLDTSSNELGGLPGGTWEIVGDVDTYSAQLHVHPSIVEQGGTLRLVGYGRYRLSRLATATTLAANAAAAATNLKFTAVTDFEVDDLITVGTTTPRYRLTSIGTTGSGGTGCNISPALAAAAVSTTALTEVDQRPPDKAIPLLLSAARAEALRRMISDRARFLQWKSRAQEENISVNELVQMVNDSDREQERLRRAYPAWQKPVPGRV